MAGPPRARDLELIDAIDALPRAPFAGEVWRASREGRDPLVATSSRSRWCDDGFDVLYTSLERDGAVAEIHALLAMQPVFPSKLRFFAHRLRVKSAETLRLADLAALASLGVETSIYRSRDYSRTQAIADVAYFLGFDGLIGPSARGACLNLVLFADRVSPDDVVLEQSDIAPIDWHAWRIGLRL